MKIQSWTPKIYPPLLIAQLAVLAIVPASVLSWSYALVLAVIAVTLFLCWRRLRLSVAHNRSLWTLLLFALIAQFAAFGILLADSLVNPQGTLIAFDSTFYFCLNSLLLTIAAAYRPAGALYRWTSIMDGFLACVIAVFFYVLLHRVIGRSAVDPSAATFIMWMFDAMAAFVALFATLRFVSTKRVDERRFFFVLMAFSWAEIVFPAIHNRFILSSESYLPEVFLSLPFVVLGVLLSRRRTVWFRSYRPSRRIRIVARSVSPFVLSVALCGVAFGQLQASPILAVSALILGVASYAARAGMILSQHLAIEDKLRRLQRDLQQTIVKDDLTQLTNRRGFYRAFKRDWDSALAQGTSLTVAMVDIDYFKLLNDTYGHLAGDNCLAAVGQALQREARLHGQVMIARYGGEEFAVLLPGYDRAAAEHILQHMKARVEVLQIRHSRAPFGVVTVSAGLATSADGEYADGEKLLDAADTALYEAKRAGRNCIRWYEPGVARNASF